MMKMKEYYAGMIYQSTWINDAIENNADNSNDIGGMKMLQNKDDHLLIQNEKENCKKLNIGKKKQFTIIEGIKLFQIMGSNNTENLNRNSFWVNIQNNRLIPERTAEQMKKFWTKYEHYTVEQWLVKAIHERVDFSFSIKKIPSSTFVQQFKQKYTIEFMKLESFDPQSDSDHLNDNNHGLILSSAHSSVYSQNLGRSISMASIGTSQNSK